MWRVSAVAALAVGLGACSSISYGPEATRFDRKKAPEIKRIAVVTPGMGESPGVVAPPVAGPAMIMFGALGALAGSLADSAVQAQREGRVHAAMAPHRKPERAAFTEQLVAAVKEQGFEVDLVAMTRVETTYALSYPPEQMPAPDAWLDCYVPGWGYRTMSFGTEGGSDAYGPAILSTCRLVRHTDRSTLMEGKFVYGNDLTSGGRDREIIADIPRDPGFAFETSDKLVEEPERAVRGLNTAISKLAQTIGSTLK